MPQYHVHNEVFHCPAEGDKTALQMDLNWRKEKIVITQVGMVEVIKLTHDGRRTHSAAGNVSELTLFVTAQLSSF
jgi:hypothetical protein